MFAQCALKGQPAPSPGHHPGFRQNLPTNALKGQKRYLYQVVFPITKLLLADLVSVHAII